MRRLVILHVLIAIIPTVWALPIEAQTPTPLTSEQETIKAVPARIILGALPYGGKDPLILTRKLTIHGLASGTALTHIDLSHANGIKVLQLDNTSEGVVLTLAVNVSELSLNQPYGQFVKKVLRFETNSSQEPQFLVPVIGWLTINETPRDFNRFVFNGSQRWQGPWANPNVAGALLSPIILLLIGAISWILENKTKQFRWFAIGISTILLLDILVLLFFLAATYSRGAWVAFIIASLFMIGSLVPLRRYAFAMLICFFLILLVLPSGIKRVATYTDIESDLSIANRLKLWTGALQMMGDHPLSGVGKGHFGNTFESDYQMPKHTAQNSTAVNDYLTFGAEKGLLLLGILLGGNACVVVQAHRVANQTQSIFLCSLNSALVSMMIASFFSTLWLAVEYQRLFGIIIASILVALGIRSLYNKENWKTLLLIYSKFFGRYTAIALTALIILAMSSLSLIPSKGHLVNIETPEGSPLQVRFFEPRWRPSKGVIFYFPDPSEEFTSLCRSTFRPLAARGWDVVAVPSDFPGSKLNYLLIAMSKVLPKKKVFVAGDGDGARTAWLAVSDPINQTVQAGAGFNFLSSNLSPELGAKPLQHPFLVFQSLYDDRVSANAAVRAKRGEVFIRDPLTLILSSDTANYASPDRSLWIDEINDYLVHQ